MEETGLDGAAVGAAVGSGVSPAAVSGGVTEGSAVASIGSDTSAGGVAVSAEVTTGAGRVAGEFTIGCWVGVGGGNSSPHPTKSNPAIRRKKTDLYLRIDAIIKTGLAIEYATGRFSYPFDFDIRRSVYTPTDGLTVGKSDVLTIPLAHVAFFRSNQAIVG